MVQLKDALKKGDVILVTGATVSEAGISSVHRSLAKVLAVGKKDIFAMLMSKNDYNRPFKAPITRCKKIDIQHISIVDEPMAPKLGDLVVSIVAYFGKLDEKVGRLKSISTRPGREKEAVLVCGAKEEKVPYSSLMVLEE